MALPTNSGVQLQLSALPPGTSPELVAVLQPIWTSLYSLFQQINAQGGFGSMSSQNSNNVNISGGKISGLTITLTGINGLAITATSAATLDVVGGKTVSFANTVSFAGTDGQTLKVNAPVASSVVATTGSSNVAPYGYTTAAQANDIITKINAIYNTLVACNIMS